jgi:hypothetical protein
MVEAKPSTCFWVVLTLSFQEAEYDARKFTSQYHQCLRGAKPFSLFLFIKSFAGRCPASCNGGIVQKSAHLRISPLRLAAATVLLSQLRHSSIH